MEYDHKTGELKLYNKHAEHKPGEYASEGNVSLVWKRDGESSKHTENELRHFVDCVRTGKKPLTDARSSLQGLRVIWALYDAEKHGVVADLRGLGLEN